MDWSPIWLSLKLSLITTCILLMIGLPMAYWLSLRSNLFKIIVEAIITMPLVLPPSVLGFYLLLTFSPRNRWEDGFMKHSISNWYFHLAV